MGAPPPPPPRGGGFTVLWAPRRSLSLGLTLAIALATVGAFALVAHRTGTSVFHAAATPNWYLLAAAFAVSAGGQPPRARAWASALRSPVGFRGVYMASAGGSFLPPVLPRRL